MRAIARAPAAAVRIVQRARRRTTGIRFLDQGAVKMASRRISSLDGLRACSIALVLQGHLAGTHGFPLTVESGRMLGDLANLGVNVFFIISGFLITSLLMEERRQTGAVSLRGFYWRRARRILPAAYAFLLAIMLAATLGWVEIGKNDVIFAATYLVNYDVSRPWQFGHLWSLSVEEQFYLLWPFVFVFVKERHALLAAAFAFAAAPLVRLAMHLAFPSGPYRDLEIFPAVADAIAIGCAFALLRPKLLHSPVYLRMTSTPWRWALLPLIVAVNYLRSGHTIVDMLAWPWMLVAMTGLIESSTRCSGTLAWRFLNWRPLAFVGTLSYSLYLWQQPFLNRHMDTWATTFPVNILLACGVALLSYYLIERPFLRLRRQPVDLVAQAPHPAPFDVATSSEAVEELRR
ncbi:MAG: acyltransferase [Dokdonella sp.]